MNGAIRTGRLKEFAISVIKKHNADTEEKTTWEFFLHKVIDKSYADFKRECKLHYDLDSDEDISVAVKNSFDMLNGFNPDSGESGERG